MEGEFATASEAADAGIAPSVADGNGDALILHSPLVAGTTVAIGGVNDPSFAKQLLGTITCLRAHKWSHHFPG